VEALARRVLGEGFLPYAVCLGAKAALPWAYASALLLLDEKGYSHVIVVLDAGSSSPSEVAYQQKQMEDQLRTHEIAEDTTVCMAVPALDAWLLAAYHEHPEAVAEPKRELAMHLALPSLRPEGAERVARELDIGLARSRSPSFDRFVQALEELAKQYAHVA
jgi:hypothetical protein